MPSIAIGCDEEEDEEVPELEEAEDSEEDTPSKSSAAGRAPEVADLRVIFLNIDGVLNTRPDPRLLIIEGGPCAMLRQLLAASGAELVLCTPWRRHHEYIAEVLANFGVFGEGAPPPELRRAPRHADASRRDLEVLQWLGANRGRVAAWAVLDTVDLLQWPSAPRLQGHVVRVAPGTGLTDSDVKAALQALGGAAPRAASSEVGAIEPSASSQGAPTTGASLGEAFRAAAAWDDKLAGKMEDLLGALSACSPMEAAAMQLQAPELPPAVSRSTPVESGSTCGFYPTGAALRPAPGAEASGGSTVAALDSELEGRMEALLSLLPRDAAAEAGKAQEAAKEQPREKQATVEESTKEFESILGEVKSRFK